MTGPSSELVRAGPEDAEAISSMAYGLLFEVYTYVPAERVSEFYEENLTADAIRSRMAEGHVYAFAVLDGGRVGYISYSIDGAEMEIGKLYLIESHRGAGLGSRIMDCLLETAIDAGVGTVRLQVNCGNHGAVRFYGRRGFRNVAVRRSYETEIMTMELRL